MSGTDPRSAAGTSLPTLGRWLLTHVTPASELPYLLDDLDEEFEARARADGRARATVWPERRSISWRMETP